jgi:hypothetical protein
MKPRDIDIDQMGNSTHSFFKNELAHEQNSQYQRSQSKVIAHPEAHAGKLPRFVPRAAIKRPSWRSSAPFHIHKHLAKSVY